MNLSVSHPYKITLSKRGPTIRKLCIATIGFSANIGEQMNIYFSQASKVFIFAGVLLMLVSIFRSFTAESKMRMFPRVCMSFWVLFYLILVISTARLTGTQFANITEIIEKLKTPLFMLCGLVLCKSFSDDEACLKIFSWAYVIGFIAMIPFGNGDFFAATYRSFGTYANPNTYAIDCLIAIFVSLYLLKDKELKVLKSVICLLAVLSLLRTGSRGALLSLFIGVSFIFLFTENFKRKLVFVVFILFILFSLFVYLSQDTTGITQRLFESSYSGNVRIQIWQAYLSNLQKYFWFGADENVISSIFYFTPHNSFLGVFVRYGIVALAAYGCFIVTTLVYSFVKGRDPKSNFPDRVLSSLLFAFTWSGITMENINSRATWVVYALVLYNVGNMTKRKFARIKGVNDFSQSA